MKTYSPSETSKMLDIPESTLRRLAKQFEAQLAPQAQLSSQKGRRRYTNKDIETLRLAREMLSARMTVKQTEQALIERMANVIDIEEEQESREAEPVENAIILRQLAQQYTALEKELEQLRSQSLADRERIKALEERLSQPWYKRLLKRS
jgi:DNA-binding transcriptional MerR regulator